MKKILFSLLLFCSLHSFAQQFKVSEIAELFWQPTCKMDSLLKKHGYELDSLSSTGEVRLYSSKKIGFFISAHLYCGGLRTFSWREDDKFLNPVLVELHTGVPLGGRLTYNILYDSGQSPAVTLQIIKRIF